MGLIFNNFSKSENTSLTLKIYLYIILVLKLGDLQIHKLTYQFQHILIILIHFDYRFRMI